MRLLEKYCVDCARVGGAYKFLNCIVFETAISKLMLYNASSRLTPYSSIRYQSWVAAVLLALDIPHNRFSRNESTAPFTDHT